MRFESSTMRPERNTGANLALTSAAIAFFAVLAIGGALGQWLISSLETRAEEAARRDAQALARSVAQTLASQFSRAARLGIPLKELPGVEAHLREALKQTPGVASITLQHAEGQATTARLETAAGRERDRVEATVQGEAGPSGQIVVTTLPAALATGFAQAHRGSALAAVLAAALAAMIAYALSGRNLARRQRMLTAALSGTLPRDGLDSSHEGDAIDEALEAWAEGERQLSADRAAFDALAEELRAVDFDDAMRPEIERLSRELRDGDAGGAR